MVELLYLLPWILSGLVAYWFRGTLGNKLAKDNAGLYKQISEKKATIEDQITAEEKTKENLEKILEALEKNKEQQQWEEGETEYTKYLQQKKQNEKSIAESEEKLAFYNQIKDKGLDGIDFSIWNIAKMAGIFLILGIILHLITKWIINWIWPKEE